MTEATECASDNPNGVAKPAGRDAGAAPNARVLTRVVGERQVWLTEVVNILAGYRWVQGIWLVGSLGRGEGDAYSDIDLVLSVDQDVPARVLADPVAGLALPGRVLYQRPKPRNGPAGGRYRAVCVELAGLPVLVDLYLWPACTAVVPAGARVLFERLSLPHTDLGFMAWLDRHRSSDTRGLDPQDPATVLMLVQLAAKYLARNDTVRLADIGPRLSLPAVGCDVTQLREVLAQHAASAAGPGWEAAVQAVRRLLEVIGQHDPAAPG